MMAKQLQAYQDNAVSTASGPQLTLMLYNGCIKFIKQAMIALDEKNYEDKNMNIQKAQNIVQELMLTLNKEIEISNQMLSLYDFIYNQLLQANIENDKEKLVTALEFITEFRDVWKEAMKQSSKTYEQGAQV